MKPSEARELTDDELTVRLTEQQEVLFNLRMQVATARLDNVKRIGETKRDIARLKTVQGERARESDSE